MALLEFAKILGTQLLHNNFDDLDQHEDDLINCRTQKKCLNLLTLISTIVTISKTTTIVAMQESHINLSKMS